MNIIKCDNLEVDLTCHSYGNSTEEVVTNYLKELNDVY